MNNDEILIPGKISEIVVVKITKTAFPNTINIWRNVNYYPLKPIFLCVPSQKGLLCDPPHRHK
jgi:hypothetical protein